MEFVFLFVGSPEQIVSPVPVLLNGLAARSEERPRYGRMESK